VRGFTLSPSVFLDDDLGSTSRFPEPTIPSLCPSKNKAGEAVGRRETTSVARAETS
jgi:hypothetical protein